MCELTAGLHLKCVDGVVGHVPALASLNILAVLDACASELSKVSKARLTIRQLLNYTDDSSVSHTYRVVVAAEHIL